MNPGDMRRVAPQPLHVLDADLPYIASEAAVEIDNIIAGHSEEPTAFKELARRLKDSFEFPAESERPQYMIDAGTLGVLEEAIRRAGQTREVNMQDTVARIVNLAGLPDSELSAHKSDLEWACQFCLALSRVAAAYRSALRWM